MNIIRYDIQELKNTMRSIFKTIQIIRDTTHIHKCHMCNKKYNMVCSCGCEMLACHCLKLVLNCIGYENTKLYFYELNCVEKMRDNPTTSCYVKYELEDFIKHYIAQNQ